MSHPFGFVANIDWSNWTWLRTPGRRRGWAKPLLLVLLVAVCFLVCCPDANAGPGGQIVKQALSTKYGKIGGAIVGGLLLIACILLLPLIVYVKFKEAIGIRRTKKDLAF